MKMEQSVPKRRHIKFRLRGIAQKKAYKTWRQFEIQKKCKFEKNYDISCCDKNRKQTATGL